MQIEMGRTLSGKYGLEAGSKPAREPGGYHPQRWEQQGGASTLRISINHRAGTTYRTAPAVLALAMLTTGTGDPSCSLTNLMMCQTGLDSLQTNPD